MFRAFGCYVKPIPEQIVMNNSCKSCTSRNAGKANIAPRNKTPSTMYSARGIQNYLNYRLILLAHRN